MTLWFYKLSNLNLQEIPSPKNVGKQLVFKVSGCKTAKVSSDAGSEYKSTFHLSDQWDKQPERFSSVDKSSEHFF